MKNFTSTAFFLLFEQIIQRDNPSLEMDRWTAQGVEWERVRHSFDGPFYGYGLEIFTATHAGKDPWLLLVTKEQWWAGRHGDPIKSQQWAKPLRGKRAKILVWFSERKRQLQR